ncbi:MAG: hypothetical protein AAFV88_04830 [Planctomycetota bacterium]
MIYRLFQQKTATDASSLSVPPMRDWLTGYPTRLAVYAISSIAASQFVFYRIETEGLAYAGRENGPVELGQAALAVCTALLLAFAAYRLRGRATLMIVGACLVGYAAARECDQWFESVFFDDAYKYLVGAPLFLIAVTTLAMNPKRFLAELHETARHPMMTIFVIAGIHICGFCQILDRPGLWSELGAGSEMTKAAVEEFAELFGYLILSFAAIEAFSAAHAEARATALAGTGARTRTGAELPVTESSSVVARSH